MRKNIIVSYDAIYKPFWTIRYEGSGPNPNASDRNCLLSCVSAPEGRAHSAAIEARSRREKLRFSGSVTICSRCKTAATRARKALAKRQLHFLVYNFRAAIFEFASLAENSGFECWPVKNRPITLLDVGISESH